MRKLTSALFMSAAFTFAYSQHTVKGKVIDELGLPVYMAQIQILGADTTTFTDVDGYFKLESEKGFHWKLDIGSAGFKPETFFVLSAGRTEDIVLKYDTAIKSLIGRTEN
ncbi:carboxypeptidase-like regulatory domain-containing protein [Croceivirga sp. JEA036]|uniref:carboxypeptidase-like regulatory domain-containing protein n=1 Tax=Croceivirga sp. JEA036 TaxID=2721162 RepID=UPI00143AC448|nr:carboxypeptidase-like regulatory domain-containing protein [Croceivirga sp. JEA036]NJB37347.1 hypothetical protein [Croceivirga sp. JEA036]